LDYADPTGTSTKRHHRAPAEVTGECDRVLMVVADLIHATTDLLRK
jgi:hypothetical protein